MPIGFAQINYEDRKEVLIIEDAPRDFHIIADTLIKNFPSCMKVVMFDAYLNQVLTAFN